MIELLAWLMVIATTLSGNGAPLRVECNVKAQPGVYGYVYLGTGPIHLAPEVCQRLREPSESRWSALGALTLGHEIGHFVLNTYDEEKAECWGLQHVPQIARLLGWDPRKTYRDARYESFCGA